MAVWRLSVGGVSLLWAELLGCSSGHNSTRIWLKYSQGEAASYFALSVSSEGRANASAQGQLENGMRPVGQSSAADLTPEQVQELERLVATDLVDVYEADDEFAPGSNVSSATEPAFFVSLDAEALESPAPRDAVMGFENDEPLSEQTRTLITKLNEILRDVWSRGDKVGPNPDIAEPAEF